MSAPRSSPRPTHAEQVELAARAKAGDREAYERLAEAVWGFVRKMAGRYGRRHRCDPDELESIGLGRLPYAVRSFDPSLGWSFLNYLASCAARAMLKAARDNAKRRDREVISHEAGELEAARDGEGHAVDAAVLEALAKVEPVGRELVRLIEVEKFSLERAAARLGLTEGRAERLHRDAFGRLSDLLAPLRGDV